MEINVYAAQCTIYLSYANWDREMKMLPIHVRKGE